MSGPQSPTHSLSAIPLFADLPDHVAAELERASRERTFPRGQILCSEGDPGNELIVLMEGQLRVSRFISDGTEAVLAVYDAPAAIGELALLDAAPRDATVTAQRKVRVRLIPREVFLDVVTREPVALQALLGTLAAMVRASNARHADFIGLDVPGRLAKWLLRQATPVNGQPVTPGATVHVHGSQSDLAAELGTTRSTLNRALHEFETLGYIELDGNSISLRKPAILRTYAE